MTLRYRDFPDLALLNSLDLPRNLQIGSARENQPEERELTLDQLFQFLPKESKVNIEVRTERT